MTQPLSELERIFAATRRAMGADVWATCVQACETAASLLECLAECLPDEPPWLQELVSLEWALEQTRLAASQKTPAPERLAPHPAVQLLAFSWKGLPALVHAARQGGAEPPAPLQGEQMVLLWPDACGAVRCEPAADEDLLALKIAAEGLALAEVAKEAGTPVAALRQLLHRATSKGLLMQPPSLLTRPESTHPRAAATALDLDDDVFCSETFTMQWHVTQRCDLNCRHCYDRSPRQDVPLDLGLRLIGELADFCEARHVQGQATFTGGNPLLHPHFFELYKAAAQRGLYVALLGNPCSPGVLDDLLALEPPSYFQISLEGLEEHNDAIRGAGHFRRSLAFLEELRQHGIPAQVMLTLTAANMPQVLPLARELAGKVERFTFNRLAPVGQGAALACADMEAYPSFLQQYIAQAEELPHMRFKDNLLNAALQQAGKSLFGGCTGHGCGAAFNFLAVLGDGEAHACRKMHSPLGNVHDKGLAAVYDGEQAARYRAGSSACSGCSLRSVCGGCLAVTAGLGQDPLTERDPYCFFNQAPQL